MVKYPVFVIDQVILIENKEESLVRARDRSAQLGLTNIGFIQTNLDYFTGNFNIGVRTVLYKTYMIFMMYISDTHRLI